MSQEPSIKKSKSQQRRERKNKLQEYLKNPIIKEEGKNNSQNIKELNEKSNKETIYDSINEKESVKESNSEINEYNLRTKDYCPEGNKCADSNCQFLHEREKYKGIPCKFGKVCTRKDCWFRHDEPKLTNIKMCYNGIMCTKASCQFIHPNQLPCRDYPNCAFGERCYFSHARTENEIKSNVVNQ
jgi:hypothetical protein